MHKNVNANKYNIGFIQFLVSALNPDFLTQQLAKSSTWADIKSALAKDELPLTACLLPTQPLGREASAWSYSCHLTWSF